jgi:hypothetical protein
MRTCDGIFSAKVAAAWLAQHGVAGRRGTDAESNGIFSMTASRAALAKFFPRERKFSRLPLDNARAASPEKISA